MNTLRTLTLKVELLAGTGIRDAACDLCELANRVGVMTEAKFNTVTLWARPGDNPLKLAEAYEISVKNGSTFKIAQASDAY